MPAAGSASPATRPRTDPQSALALPVEPAAGGQGSNLVLKGTGKLSGAGAMMSLSGTTTFPDGEHLSFHPR